MDGSSSKRQKVCDIYSVERQIYVYIVGCVPFRNVLFRFGKFAQVGGDDVDPSVSGYKSGSRSSKQSGHSLEEKLSQFWSEMMEDVKEGGTDLTEFKTQQLPLARIKKVRM